MRRLRAGAARTGDRLRRRRSGPGRRIVPSLLVVAVLATAIGLGAARTEVDTGVESFLPSGDPAPAAMERKASDFGGEPVVVLLRGARPHELLTDPQQLRALLRTEGALAKLPDVAAVYGPATALNQVAGSAQDLLLRIAGRRDGLRIAAEQRASAAGDTPEQVRAAGEQATRELVLRYAPLLVRGLPAGLPTLNNPSFAASVIYDGSGAPKERWRAIVPDASTVAVLVRPRQAIDQAATGRLVDAVRATVRDDGPATTATTVSGVPVVTSELSAQVVREIPLVAGLVAVIVLLRFLLVPAVTGGGGRRRRLIPFVATLTGGAATYALFGWAGVPLSFGAVALLPVLLGVGSAFPIYLCGARDRRPVLVLAGAAVAACAALALSPLGFVRDLGLALAAGLTLTVLAALALDRWWPAAAPSAPSAPSAPEAPEVPPADATPVRRGATPALRVLLALAVVTGAVGWVALSGLDVRADPRQMAGGLPAIADALAVERALGSSGEVGIVLRGPDVAAPEALAWAHRADSTVRDRFGGRLRPLLGPSDVLSFLGDRPSPAQVSAALELVPSYLTSTVLRGDRQAGVQILGLELQDLGSQSALLDELGAALPPPPAGYEGEVVGLPVAAGAAYTALLADRWVVNVAGIAAAGLVLALGLRRRSDAARAVLASAVATGWGFGLLALLGIGLSPLTVGLGALVTVTGCEFAVLLRSAHGTPTQVSRGVLVAAVTSAAGYAVLAVSGLEVVREFGLVLAGAVVLSYLSAVLVVRATTGRAPAAGARPADTRVLTEVPS